MYHKIYLVAILIHSCFAENVQSRFWPFSKESANVQEYEGWNLMEDFDILHQVVRMRHLSPELTINVTYVVAARARAVEYALQNGKVDRYPFMLDENVHYHPKPNDQVTASDVMDVWYRDAEKKYDYENPEVNDENISFARIASKTTQEYGCGQAKITNQKQGIYTICLYSPPYLPGNENENIGRPQYGFEPEFDLRTAQESE